MSQFLHGVETLELGSGPRPVKTVQSAVIGVVGTAPDADESDFPMHKPVLVAGNRLHAAKLGAAGTLAGAVDGIFDQIGAAVVVIRVPEGASTADTMANVIGGANAATDEYEGLHALKAAESVVGVSPKLLIAPGFSHQRPEGNANAVTAEAVGIADRLLATFIQDGPNETDSAAIAAAGDNGSSRVYLVDPWHNVAAGSDIIAVPPSSRVAGVIARTDHRHGFSRSPSNQLINGITGTSRAVDFAMGQRGCRANILNEAKVATTIRHQGFRLWGNRSLSSDTAFQFLCVRRTADILNDSLTRAHLWAVDQGITSGFFDAVTESVNGFIRDLVAAGQIIGGRCWADPDLNTASAMQNGEAFFDFEFSAVYPAEHITFRSRLVNGYLEDVL